MSNGRRTVLSVRIQKNVRWDCGFGWIDEVTTEMAMVVVPVVEHVVVDLMTLVVLLVRHVRH